LCGLALGSDGLGSIRTPAGFTGVFGLKPQRGRVWHGPSDWNGLAVNGPITRTVADAALFLDATAEPLAERFTDALASELGPLRVAVAWKSLARFPLSARLADEPRRAVEATVELLRSLGHTVVERELEFSRHASSNLIARYLAGVTQSVSTVEHPDELSSRTRRLAGYGRLVSDRRLRRAREQEATIARAMNRIFEAVDVVLSPGAIQPPLRIGQLDRRGALRTFITSGRMIPHYGPWNVIGQPAVSVPAGFSSSGLPLSIQLAGRAHDEATLLALSAQLEAVRPWANVRPDLDQL
jgi:amidase